MLIYVVRHGETEYNKEEIFRGRKDMSLNEKGQKQASRVGAYFKDKHIGRIVASPLMRAQQTAKSISEAANVPVETIEEFTDMNFGIWEGISLKEVERMHAREYALWGRWPQKLKVKDGETLLQVRKRMHKGVQKIITGEKRDIVIVTHRVLCKLMILHAMNIPNSRFWAMKFDPASISLIQQRDGVVTVHFVNDTCHLKEGLDVAAGRDF